MDSIGGFVKSSLVQGDLWIAFLFSPLPTLWGRSLSCLPSPALGLSGDFRGTYFGIPIAFVFKKGGWVGTLPAGEGEREGSLFFPHLVA